MKYFITGATGFVGSNVAKQLRRQGHEVIAIARNPAKGKDLADMGVVLHKGDITDKESMRAPMAGVDGVFHIAGWYKLGTKDKAEGAKINIDGTRKVLTLMKELGISRGVYTSTLAVNSDTHGVAVDETYRFTGTHISEYDRTKAEAHRIAEEMIAQGLPLVIVQPGLVYGPGDNGPGHDTWVQYLQRKLPVLVEGVAYAWGYIDDIAEAHILAMEKGRLGENYFTCGPVYTFIEAMKLAEKITGIPAPKLVLSPGVMKAMSSVMGVMENVVSLPPLFSSEFLRVSAGVTYIARNDKAKRELGWNPRPLEAGLPVALRWEMEQLGVLA